MHRFAAIDCGTNTFHLLIAEPLPEGGFREVYRERSFIKLASEGIERIGDSPYRRALKTLQHFAAVVRKYRVDAVRVSGTAALRTAENGPELVAEVEATTGLTINVIPGREEARLIYRGVNAAVGPQQGRRLVMDIGGGSVEFIIVDEKGVRWFDSFPVGVAVLYKHFHRTDPISEAEVEETRQFLREELSELVTALHTYPTTHLIGAAGTFDVIADVLGAERPTPHSAAINLAGFRALYERVLVATQDERHAMHDIPSDRADMIVVALILVELVLDLAATDRMTVSHFSLKEGMLAEMMEEQRRQAK